MTEFLKEEIKDEKFELLIDSNIFSKDIVLKAAYNMLDRGYFFFKLDKDDNIILQFTKKSDYKESDQKKIIGDYYDELLGVYLRDKLEKDNKTIREAIINTAITGSFDSRNFVSINMDQADNQNKQIDFDKDIDEILREIENDPDLKIDEEEIERILKEIEEESQNESTQKITLDLKNAKDAKDKFQNRK